MSQLAARLDSLGPVGLRELGGAWDDEILIEIRRFATLDESNKQAIRSEMNQDRSWAIVSWAEGMATLAVREADPQRLVYGLVGLSLFERNEFDAREAMVVYPLFVRAAELIGEKPDDLALAAAALSDSAGRLWLLERLPSEQHRIASTHSERGVGRDFRFQRLAEDWDPEAELSDYDDDRHQ